MSLLTDALERLAQAGVESPRFEAQLLLAMALGVSRTTVITATYPEPTAEQEGRFARLVAQREQRVPLAYLRGTQEFYGLPFTVSPATLIPRPETELLVDFARERLAARLRSHPESETVPFADIGTGSGCIAIAVLANVPQASAVGVDISPAALTVAAENARQNGVAERIQFIQASLLAAVGTHLELIVANPPYIPAAQIPTLQPEVRDFEPHLALDGGQDGLDFYRVLARSAASHLRPGGWLAVEVGQGQAEAVAAEFQHGGWQNVGRRRDLAGIERIVFGQGNTAE